MRVLPEKEFRELVVAQQFSAPELTTGIIDKYTHEAVVPVKATTRAKLHELGHEELDHFPSAVRYYGRGKKDVQNIREPWTHQVDDEIEAEMYSFRTMDKKLTPMVGMGAIHMLLSRGWDSYRALSLVTGRLRKYGINTSFEDRRKIAKILERSWGVKVWGY